MFRLYGIGIFDNQNFLCNIILKRPNSLYITNYNTFRSMIIYKSALRNLTPYRHCI